MTGPEEVISYFLEMYVKVHRPRSASTELDTAKGLRNGMDPTARDTWTELWAIIHEMDRVCVSLGRSQGPEGICRQCGRRWIYSLSLTQKLLYPGCFSPKSFSTPKCDAFLLFYTWAIL